jgi:hypothetical protein
MRSIIDVGVLLGGLVALAGPSGAQAPPAEKRQYYEDKWNYQEDRKYWYKAYYYKPDKDDKEYKRLYLVYKPQRTTAWVYWLNPDTQRFGGRTATTEHPTLGEKVKKGQYQWSVLPKEKRCDSLDAISDDDFGPVQEGGAFVLGSKDKEPLAAPPTDLPKEQKK